MPAAPPRSPLPAMILLPLALLAVAVGAVMGGALLLDAFPGLSPWIVAALQLVFGMGVPLYLAAQALAGLAARKPQPAVVTATALLLWNLAWITLPAALSPETTGRALTQHYNWWLFNAEAPGLRAGLDQLVAWATGAPPPQVPEAPAPAEAPKPAEEPTAPAGPLSASELFAKRADSVVVIRVQVPPGADLVRALLGLGGRGKAAADPPLAEALGSGFVVSSDGLIVTNWHVMQDARRAKVTLRSGTVLEPVTVVAKMPDRDLALISVPAVGLSPLTLSTRAVAVGETAYAIGSPIGFEYTLTQGIISATRELGGASFLQTQTPIAPGSSGGPLLDDRGELIGVNTAGMSQGSVGLAVQARHVREVLALPRAAQALEPFVQGPTVVALELSGMELTPTDHENLLKGASMIAAQLDACGLTLPEKAWLKAPLAANESQKDAVRSNLTGEDLDCARRGPALAWLVTMMVTEGRLAAHPEASLHLEVDHLRPVGGDTRTPEERAITLDLGPPAPTPADDAL